MPIIIVDGKQVYKPIRCSVEACINTNLDTGWFLGSNGEDLCLMHAKESWSKYRKSLYPADHPIHQGPSLNKPNQFLNVKRLTGVLIRYLDLPNPVPSIWTPTKAYPYPNHRRKLGLKGSYPLDKVKVVSWGKHQDPTLPQANQGQEVKA